MNKTLRSKIVEDIERTGFGAEMRAAQVFQAEGCECYVGQGYMDLDENKMREIDIVACKLKRGDARLLGDFYIVAEVKKTASPWVVFQQDLHEWESVDAWNNIILWDYLPEFSREEREAITAAMSVGSLMVENNWKGVGIHQSFKDPDSPSRWYSAFTAVCKATEDTLQKERAGEEDERPMASAGWSPSSFYLFQPLVIVDGILVGARLSSSGEVRVQEIDSAAFDFSYASKAYTRGDYRVDVVTLRGLSKYLKLVDKRQESIFQAIVKQAKLSSRT